MKFIFGLGNIGGKYDQTRHNIGFMAVDNFATAHDLSFSPSKQFSTIAKATIHGESVMLIKPTTYMNESGQAVRAILDYYDGNIDDIMILVDDMDMPFGKMRLRDKGSAGGHNGLKSIIAHTNSQSFLRLKFGLGHPLHEQNTVINYVLGKFTTAEKPEVEQMLNRSTQAIEDWIQGATTPELSNKYNG
ncbi:peptidyl-tRNA hydrolase [Leuconostoc litchii]|uniref:Peptidyl-tRNA hydrolase n=1 Tax=Leuconostoc litchii TaxID=1981069 RepID=A0A6P2CTK0_9LACO|nr:aminoacyl-tRNA hydrolase [Leuconostoc litchii]TYC47509.1 aminoacyl-tRNA hydrolase [Leuconostoc litchii]GMA69535.1 peptidyl-tRNA hydrolase [Leuconostoc litchii]